MTASHTSPTEHARLTHGPAYLGLFAAQLLAVACNAFLDIRYGSFGLEVLLWGAVLATTLRIGWHQQGQPTDKGKKAQTRTLILGLVLFVVLFLPMWGLPRAGIALLAMLQCAYNCVTVSRRQLHLGLLVSAVLVMFAASHHRADWTMLFYLVPYVTAVVFTLVAEQINQRIEALHTLGTPLAMERGQGVATLAATLTLLLTAATLYAATPQLTLAYLEWRFGQPSNLGRLQAENAEPGQALNGASGDGEAHDNSTESMAPAGSGWPTPAEMREAASRPGMPGWQSKTMQRMADMQEGTLEMLQPLSSQLGEWRQALEDWLDEHQNLVFPLLLVLATLGVLFALWALAREARAGTWLLTRLDYLRFRLPPGPAPGVEGARQIVRATERLLSLHMPARQRQTTLREYLQRIQIEGAVFYPEALELFRLFEQMRYGPACHPAAIARMTTLYRDMLLRS